MASEKSLSAKKQVVDNISSKIKDSSTFLVMDYQGLTVQEFEKLRNDVKNTNSEIRVFKNTMLDRALKDNKIDLSEFMTGANVSVFSNDIIEPIKAVSSFAKDNDKLVIKAGCINGEVVDLETIKEYASIPSYEGLLTMFAGGLMEHLRNFSIGLNLYAEKLEGGEK